jgi:hypothetical protein
MLENHLPDELRLIVAPLMVADAEREASSLPSF